MTTITFLGGEETGNVAHVDWGGYRFTIGQPVECRDPHIIAKARGNRFYRVDGEVIADPLPATKSDPLAKARAAKAAKRAGLMTAAEADKADAAGDAA